MAIELPGEVVTMLDFIGVKWPSVNEDKVREFAGHVRDFADNLDTAHNDSTTTLHSMAQAYQGASYEALLATWGRMSTDHMSELVTLCHGAASALDIAADVVVGMKVEAIGELIGLAATFAADQAAAIVTFGLAEAASAFIVEAAKKCINFLESQIEDYVVSAVLEAALGPLIDAVGRAAGGLLFKATEDVLGVDPDDIQPPGPGDSFYLHPQQVRDHADLMHGHAQTVASHASDFLTKASAVDFT